MFYQNLHKVEWVLPEKIYPTGPRVNLRVFGSNFKEANECRFEPETGGSFSTIPIFHDLTYVECPLPDFSTVTVTDMVEVLFGLPQADGRLSNTSKIRIHLIKRPQITSISPLKGFAKQGRDIRITGTNFYKLETLHVKATFKGNINDLLLNCLIVSDELVIIKAPNALNIPLYNDRTMSLYVSSNGVDYSLEDVKYTYMDEPHITSLTEFESDYEGNVETEAIGLHFTDDVTHCVIGNQYVPAVFDSSTKRVKCTIPPSDKHQVVRFKLVFFGNYEVNNTDVYFTYLSLKMIEDFTPKQAHVSGGLKVTITGNFESLENKPFKLYFGDVDVTAGKP